MKLTEFRQGRIIGRIDRDRKSRMIPKNTEKDQIALIDKRLDMLMFKQHRMLRIAIDQALVSPDRYKATVFAYNSVSQPIEILAPLATSIDERAGKYIVIPHLPARVQALA